MKPDDPDDIGLHFKNAQNLSENEKYEVIKNIWKPPPNYVFQQHVDSDRHWRFKGMYIDEKFDDYYPWLAYSSYYDGTFCIPCVFFGHNFGHTKLTKQYKEPLTRWNGAPSCWEDHSKTGVKSIHASSMLNYQTLIKQMEGKEEKMEDIADSTTRQRIAENRRKLMPILKTVVLCGQQNIAIRAHRDNSGDQEDKSHNSGNFQALIDFRIDAGDEVLLPFKMK